jgi:CHRD domain-containing protein
VLEATALKERVMKRKVYLPIVLAQVLLTTVVAPLNADENTVKTRLNGYEETPLTINSAASAEFKARIHDNDTAIDYELTYRDLSSPTNQAHIHFGRRAISGMIALFLCTNLTPPPGVPTPQACPNAVNTEATITGTLTAADVIALPAQGIDAGAAGFAEMVKAIRAGAAYTNVHTVMFPSGEIRGQFRRQDDDHHHEDGRDDR